MPRRRSSASTTRTKRGPRARSKKPYGLSDADLDGISNLEGSSTLHDVLRGGLDALPVGQPLAETCLGSVAGSTIDDAEAPQLGAGFVYLVRGRNVCGSGTYGYQSKDEEQISTACP